MPASGCSPTGSLSPAESIGLGRDAEPDETQAAMLQSIIREEFSTGEIEGFMEQLQTNFLGGAGGGAAAGQQEQAHESAWA